MSYSSMPAVGLPAVSSVWSGIAIGLVRDESTADHNPPSVAGVEAWIRTRLRAAVRGARTETVP